MKVCTLFFDGLISMPLRNLRTFHPRKSNPCSICVMLVLSGDPVSRPSLRRDWRGYIVPPASHRAVASAACSGRLPVIEHRFLFFSYLLSSNNHSSDFTSHPEPIIPKYETPATLLVRFQLLTLRFRLRIRDVVNSPEHDDLTLLALPHRSAKLVRLLEGEPVGRDVLGRRQQEEIHTAILLLRHEVARRSRCAPRPSPRDYTLFQQVDDPLAYDFVAVHCRSAPSLAPASPQGQGAQGLR